MNNSKKISNPKYLLLPINDLIDKNLTLLEVAILSQIAYMKKAFVEIFPTNATLGKLLNVCPRSIQRAVQNLSNHNYITFTIKNNNKRYIELTDKCNSTYKEIYKKTDYDEMDYNPNTQKNDMLRKFLKGEFDE